jgi:hypothetical protein
MRSRFGGRVQLPRAADGVVRCVAAPAGRPGAAVGSRRRRRCCRLLRTPTRGRPNAARHTHPVVLAVRHAPAVVGHHDGGVHDVADKVVQLAAGAEALVAAVVADHEQRPEHGALREPVQRPHEPGAARGGGRAAGPRRRGRRRVAACRRARCGSGPLAGAPPAPRSLGSRVEPPSGTPARDASPPGAPGVGGVRGGGEADDDPDIQGEVREGARHGALKAVRRDRVADVRQAERRRRGEVGLAVLRGARVAAAGAGGAREGAAARGGCAAGGRARARAGAADWRGARARRRAARERAARTARGGGASCAPGGGGAAGAAAARPERARAPRVGARRHRRGARRRGGVYPGVRPQNARLTPPIAPCRAAGAIGRGPRRGHQRPPAPPPTAPSLKPRSSSRIVTGSRAATRGRTRARPRRREGAATAAPRPRGLARTPQAARTVCMLGLWRREEE